MSDSARLTALCDREREAIRAAFPQWYDRPADDPDPSRRDKEVQALVQVAQVFANGGDLSLLQHVMGGASPVELGEWHAAMTAAIEMGRGGRPSEAARTLEALVTTYAHLPGATASNLRARTWGQAGTAWSEAGDQQRAREATTSALELCARDRDSEGVAVYTANLAHIDARLQQPGLKVGPPVATPTGYDVAFVVVGHRDVPAEAQVLQAQGRAAVEAGRLGEARRLLQAAMAAAPEWPQPVDDAAFIALCRGEFLLALELYRRVDRLAPSGFFQSKAAIHTLEREVAGELPFGAYRALVQLEHMPRDQARQQLVSVTEHFPDLGRAWLMRIGLALSDAERAEVVRAGLAAKCDVDTLGALRANQAIQEVNAGDRSAGVAALADIANDPASTDSNRQMARMLLERFTGPGPA